MTAVALITGASSGIGAEFARVHAAAGDDLVLVARDIQRLAGLRQELQDLYGVEIMIISEDLSVAGAAQRVFAATEAAGLEIGMLVNNAGFGGHGKFHERELPRDEAMMQVNMVSLSSLTHLYVQAMVRRGRGRILNVASTAGFLPGPLQAVYYASKAYVLSFSQALAAELAGTGVTVTTLCPGPVTTPFIERANLDGLKVFKSAVSAESVARFGHRSMKQGRLVAINQPSLSFLLNWVLPFLPRRFVLKMSRRAMEQRG